MDMFIMILCLYVLPTLFIILYVKYFNKEEKISPAQTLFMILPIINFSWIIIILTDCVLRFMDNNWLTDWLNEGKEFTNE